MAEPAAGSGRSRMTLSRHSALEIADVHGTFPSCLCFMIWAIDEYFG
jgi:hypothetical protein